MARTQNHVVPTLVTVVSLLAIWEILALVIGQEIIMVSPVQVGETLVALVPQSSFWATIAHSLIRIVAGFAMAFLLGVATAWLASVNRWVESFASTVMRLVRSIPVVSFIILLLIWADSAYIGLWVSFLMVVPVIYSNAESGFSARDVKLVQMAQVFGFSPLRRWWAITLPGLMPYLMSACRVGFGLAWKAGVSAEVIGMPSGSIGERLYQAKIYLSTADLFAWTAVIVVLSYLCEKCVVLGLARLQVALGKYANAGRAYRNRKVVGTEAQAGVEARTAESTQIRFDNVCFSYGDVSVLTDLSFEVDKGVLWLAGANGTGKSTAIHLALGLLHPTSGSVEAPSIASAVFQEDRLCEQLTAVANVRLGLRRKVTNSEIVSELSDAGLAEEDSYRPVSQLSGGQRRRVTLVRALMRDCDLLCLDEPYTGIDEPSLEGLADYTLARIRTRCVLLVCHDAEVAARFSPSILHLGPEPIGRENMS